VREKRRGSGVVWCGVGFCLVFSLSGRRGWLGWRMGRICGWCKWLREKLILSLSQVPSHFFFSLFQSCLAGCCYMKTGGGLLLFRRYFRTEDLFIGTPDFIFFETSFCPREITRCVMSWHHPVDLHSTICGGLKHISVFRKL